ncbi:hypothetical protein Vafri_13653, partial [Volvox africanus]
SEPDLVREEGFRGCLAAAAAAATAAADDVDDDVRKAEAAVYRSSSPDVGAGAWCNKEVIPELPLLPPPAPLSEKAGGGQLDCDPDVGAPGDGFNPAGDGGGDGSWGPPAAEWSGDGDSDGDGDGDIRLFRRYQNQDRRTYRRTNALGCMGGDGSGNGGAD